MDDGLKQRLVGAIVLVALAVIFIPQLFDKETPYQVVKEPIPPPPSVVAKVPAFIEQQRQQVAERKAELADQKANKQSGLEDQQPIELVTEEALEQPVIAAVETPQQSVKPQQASNNQEASSKTENANTVEERKGQHAEPGLDEQGLPISWTLQLATFGNQTNANKLLSELRMAGYKAYSKQVLKGQKNLTRVFVGPSLSKASIIKQQQSIVRRWPLKGLVMRFRP